SIKSSLRESSSAGVISVRSWMRTSCRRSLALLALFFFPRSRSKKLMSLPPRQPLNTIPDAALVIKIKEGHSFTFEAFRDISKCLSCSALGIIRHWRTAIGANNDVFVFRNDTDQFDSQKV